jgi:hypothetical protein
METKFTPGPWVYRYSQEDRDDWGEVRSGTDNQVICRIRIPRLGWDEHEHHRREGTDPTAATAHLIAAAPDLYEALTMVRDADDDCRRDGLPTIPPAARSKIDAALARARGESK